MAHEIVKLLTPRFITTDALPINGNSYTARFKKPNSDTVSGNQQSHSCAEQQNTTFERHDTIETNQLIDRLSAGFAFS